MIDRNTPKKSEMLEIRIPHPTKTAFMEKARAEGRPASEIVRDQIDRYLAAGDKPVAPPKGPAAFVRKNAKSLLMLAGAAVAAVGMSVAISPASAQPDLKTAFAALDTDGDGVVSLAEFTDPKKALETNISGSQTIPNARVAIAAPQGSGAPAYLRFMLDTGTADGMLPLVVVVDMPEGGLASADFAKLVGKAFAGLDRNGDGRLTADEFNAG